MSISEAKLRDSRAVQHPSDLAALVRAYLSTDFARAKNELGVGLGIPDLGQLFETLFYLSLQTEEGQHITCSLTYMPRKTKPKAYDRGKPHVIVSAWNGIPFPQPLRYNIRTLRKLAQAVDPSFASLGVYPHRNELFIWGIVDQFPLHMERFTSWESLNVAGTPGLFCVRITAPGELTVYIRDRVFATLRQSKLVSREYDALWRGPLSSILDRDVRKFQRKVRQSVGSNLYRSAGKWFEGTDELYRCSEDFGPDLRDQWLGILCRILLKARAYRHGGAIIISPHRTTPDLSIKYHLAYDRLTNSLQTFAEAYIYQQCVETEARQGRLHKLRFRSQPTARRGYFITPDARENIFMDGVVLRDHEVLFRSWYYLAQRSDALAAVAGAVSTLASLTRIDGALLLQDGFSVAGFGVEIRTKADVKTVYVAQDENATDINEVDPSDYGTRHRSMMRYCYAHPGAVGLVISQDGEIRAMTKVSSKLIMWEQLQLRAGTPDEYIFPAPMRESLFKVPKHFSPDRETV